MANLTPTAGWDNVPQIELFDQLGGGPGGRLNQQAQAILNYITALRQGRIITPLDPGVGCVGDGVADDWAAMQGLITSLKKPSITLNTPALADENLSAIPRVTVDLMGKVYRVSKKLDFADLYYVNFRNGTILADDAVTWNDDPVLYIAKPQAWDMDKTYRIQVVRFDGVTVDGNYVANCVYLENAFAITFDGDSVIRRWKDGGYGLRSGPDSSPYIVKCGRLRLGRAHFWQVDLAASGLRTPSGSGIIIRSSDFIIDGTKVNACDVACDLDGMTNGQVVALHTFVESSQVCLKIGENAANLAITTLYSDTGLVQFRSFSHIVSNGIFTANSQVQFIATQPNETMAGLQVQGLFAKQPQYLTEGSGSWSPTCKGFIVGRMTGGGPSNGAKVLGRGGSSLGRQSASLPALTFNDDSASDYNTGLYSPAANEVAWSTLGTRAWGIDANGRQLFGPYGTSIPTAQNISPKIQLHSTDAGGAAQVTFRWSSAASLGGQQVVGRSNSNVIGTLSAIKSGQNLGRYGFVGDNGTNINPVGAAITAEAYSDWGSSNYSAELGFWTTPSPSTTLTLQWKMGPTGAWYPIEDGTKNLGTSTNRIGKINAVEASFDGPVKLASYTTTTLPNAATYAQCMIYVSNGASNKRLAVSDGTNWRWPDGAIVS